jgi:hypothetical protein
MVLQLAVNPGADVAFNVTTAVTSGTELALLLLARQPAISVGRLAWLAPPPGRKRRAAGLRPRERR